MSQPAKSHKPAYAHGVSPHLICAGAAKAIEFYKAAFGAEEIMRIASPDGRLMHASILVNGSSIMLVDEMPQMGALGPSGLAMSPVTIHLFVPDVDVVMARAQKAGARVVMPAADMFWGDRYGVLVDPFGHRWSVATHKLEMSPSEMQAAMDQMLAGMQAQGQGCGGPPPIPGAFTVFRDLDAPRELVWSLFTEADHMKAWWGPKGATIRQAHIDARPGGRFHYGMEMPNKEIFWGLFVFREVAKPDRLIFESSFSDEAGGVTRHPLAPTWPLRMMSRFDFIDAGPGKTRFSVTWRPLDASPEEQKAFEEGFASMQGGWAGTMDRLEAHISRLAGVRPS